MLLNTKNTPPQADKKHHAIKTHGDVRQDNYYWLNQRDEPEVLNYLSAENAYTESEMNPVLDFQNTLFEEMKSRVKERDESVPFQDGKYWYYHRFEEGGEYAIWCRKLGEDSEEQILLNGNEYAEGMEYFHLAGMEISDDASIMAFGVDAVGRRNYDLRFKNIVTGEFYPECIKDTEGGAYAWAADNKTIFYLRRDEKTLLSSKVYRHVLGTDTQEDVLVYEEMDNQFYMNLWRGKSGKYIFIQSEHHGVCTEVQLLEADNPFGEFKTFLEREQGHEYYVEHRHQKFYIKTNRQKAENFKLMEVEEVLHNDVRAWKDFLPHDKEVYVENMELFEGHLAVEERYNGLTRIRIVDIVSQNSHFIDFEEPAYTVSISVNKCFATDTIRYAYTSLTTPMSVYDYHMNTKTKTLKKEQEIPSGYNKYDYTTERLWVTAHDGKKIPVSIVYKKGFKRDGASPLLLYAYGSYGMSMDVYFSAHRLSLLDRGFAFAIAHVRGGQELGRYWYEEGRLLQKLNTFNDFIACSEYLITEKWTSKEGLFAMGGSAGGMLMGGIANMRPDLYKGIVAQVPFVDVLTTMLDDTLPLTTGEYMEWGNPNQKEYYDYMKRYSPYDNVTRQNYPNMLVSTGFHDSQVQYFEPAKWVAKLRENKTDNNLLLFHCDMDSGHGGASGRFQRLKEIAMEYAFILSL